MSDGRGGSGNPLETKPWENLKTGGHEERKNVCGMREARVGNRPIRALGGPDDRGRGAGECGR